MKPCDKAPLTRAIKVKRDKMITTFLSNILPPLFSCFPLELFLSLIEVTINIDDRRETLARKYIPKVERINREVIIVG